MQGLAEGSQRRLIRSSDVRFLEPEVAEQDAPPDTFMRFNAKSVRMDLGAQRRMLLLGDLVLLVVVVIKQTEPDQDKWPYMFAAKLAVEEMAVQLDTVRPQQLQLITVDKGWTIAFESGDEREAWVTAFHQVPPRRTGRSPGACRERRCHKPEIHRVDP